MSFAALKAYWQRILTTPHARRVGRVLRVGFVIGVVGFLVYQLSSIGWAEVWQALPRTPWYYATVLAMYFLLPVSEAYLYRTMWGARFRDCLAVLIRKKVLNQDVMGYSGEVYLYAWAKRNLALPPARIAGAIKDNLILSSLASVGTAVLLLGGLLAGGWVRLDAWIQNPSPLYLTLGAFAAVLVAGAIVRFRGALFSYGRRDVVRASIVHTSRFTLGYILQVVQWWVVVPTASFDAWALLLVLMVVTNRIPLLPSKDLLFVGAGVGLSAMMDVPEATIAGMLLVRSGIDKLLNLTLFSYTALRARSRSESHDEALQAGEADLDALAANLGEPATTSIS